MLLQVLLIQRRKNLNSFFLYGEYKFFCLLVIFYNDMNAKVDKYYTVIESQSI